MLDTENSQSVKESIRHSYPPLLNRSSSLLHPASPPPFLSRDRVREMSPQTLSLSLIPWGHSSPSLGDPSQPYLKGTSHITFVSTQLQETLILLASIDPWIQNKLKNKVFCAYEAPKVSEKAEPTRFRKEPENPNELNIQDFGLAQLKPLFVAKYSTPSDQQGRLRVQNGSAFPFTSACPPCFSPPLKDKAQATGPWAPRIRKQLQILAKTSK